jgi:predicted PurR-regulated permease PerM
MDRERITRVFFFGFLALMGYELYSLLSPFLVPIAWAMLLAFIVHPAFLRLMRVVRSPTAAALLFTAMLALILALPTVWLSGKLATEASKAVSFGEFMR